MLGLLILFAVGVGAYALSGDDDSGSGAETNTGTTDSSSGDDAIAGSQWEQTVDQDEISEARSLDILNFVDGPIVVNTGEGNDVVLGSTGDDQIQTGADDDYVIGDEGDDTINLGDGDDIAGFALRPDGSISTGSVYSEPGDDVIKGGPGADQISDLQGSNTLEGNVGNDTLVALDVELGGGFQPDMVFGGFGSDTIEVDSGDTVNTGPGEDTVIINLFNFSGDGDAPAPVTLTDINIEQDQIILEGPAELLNTPPITDPEDIFVQPPVTELISPITVVPLEGEAGSSIRVDGVEIVRVLGVEGLTRDDIEVRN